jgi:hypothetical protein
MAQTAVAADFNQALDVELHFAPQIAFHAVISLNHVAQRDHLGIG